MTLKKNELAELVARLTIIVGTLTNWQSPLTEFAKRHSQVNLSFILRKDFRLSELMERLDSLVDELDNTTITYSK